MTAVGLLVLGAGVVLIYSGVKGDDPREVLRSVLTGKAPSSSQSSKPKNTPASDGKSGTGPDGQSGGGTGGGGGTSW